MPNTIQLIVWGSVIMIVLVLSETARAILKWMFLKLMPGVFEHPWAAIKTLLHEIIMAHKTVFYNLQPRKRVFFELSRKRTTEYINRD